MSRSLKKGPYVDEKLLKNKKTHEDIARAITESILQFKEKYEALR